MFWRKKRRPASPAIAKPPATPELFRAFVDWAGSGGATYSIGEATAWRAIRDASAERQRDVLRAALAWDEKAEDRHGSPGHQVGQLVKNLLGRHLPLEASDLVSLLDWDEARYGSATGAVLRAVERFAERGDVPTELAKRLSEVRDRLRGADSSKDAWQLDRSIAAILGEDEERLPLDSRAPWAACLEEDLSRLDDEARGPLEHLLLHAGAAAGSRPTKAWLAEAEKRLEALDAAYVSSAIRRWLEVFDRPDPAPDHPHRAWAVTDINAEMLKGVLWLASFLVDDDMIRAVAAAAISGQRKLPSAGPRSNKVTNAALWTLGRVDRELAIAQLAILRSRIVNKSVQNQIAKAMDAVAERIGVPPDELEEMVVPALGLTEVGRRRERLGEYTAELVVATSNTELRWIKPDGKPQKSVPKAVKDDFADELADLKAAVKDVEKLLPAQRERIDGLFLAAKSWPGPTWRERYLDHPLVGVLARRLIWDLETPAGVTAVVWSGGELVDVEGNPVALDPATVTVRLWHPIGRDVAEVTGWRRRLGELEITQPFKQAHREVYPVTEAERATGTYSNRFAAHILKQHQLHALCRARRWRSTLRLLVDDEFPPATRELPAWGVRAEFWIDGVGDEFGVDTVESGAFRYVATDQVRFCATGPDPLPVAEVPPLVFSEIMRDVDLFVGVASVGNDPEWIDGGPDVRQRAYWHSFAFGDLGVTARTRKEVLERLVPRLVIASQCSFDERSLVVVGSLRTYKIHLGSGNVMMEPNDQYLCIVPRASSMSSATSKVRLPFEGDRTLAIILSKAFLLAADDKITDRTILTQIGGS